MCHGIFGLNSLIFALCEGVKRLVIFPSFGIVACFLSFFGSVKINNIEYTPPPDADAGDEGAEGSKHARTKGPWGAYRVSITLKDGAATVIECDALLNATGRVPNVCNLGLEQVKETQMGREATGLFI